MATMRANPRQQVGSASWISEERASALQIVEAESEEFTFSARNEIEWLNEHMAEIFSKNQVKVAEIFKTPGKLRGKTPRTIRKNNALEGRAPLTDVFSSTPRGGPSPFRQAHFEKPVATFKVAEDEPGPSKLPDQEETQFIQESLPQKPPTSFLDSGYHGSQANDATQPTQLNEVIEDAISFTAPTPPPKDRSIENLPTFDAMVVNGEADERRTTEGSFQSAKEEQMRSIIAETNPEPEQVKTRKDFEEATPPVLESPLLNRTKQLVSPQKRSPEPAVIEECSPKPPEAHKELALTTDEDEPMNDVRSPSEEGSSPLRPIVRKSSLNFASLPAREPITTKKSIGNRVSRTSQLEHSRTSYYGRQTGGKSLGSSKHEDAERDEDEDIDMDALDQDGDAKMSRLHNKTSTQRLQDQISMLGKSQANVRPSKSIANTAALPSQPSQGSVALETQHPKSPVRSPQRLPQRQNRPFAAPGAFPEDEDDSWIGPPTAAAAAEPSVFSPRPQMTKYHSTDVMEGIDGKDSIGGSQFNILKRGDEQRPRSPQREQPVIPDRTTSNLGHIKSVSTSVLRSPRKAGDSPGHQKAISVSNPNPSVIPEDETAKPPKSPLRSHRGSPLKAAKDKFSSILKTSRGLFASSAAVSAEAKTSALSPPSNRIGVNAVQSFEDALQSQPHYSDLDTLVKDVHRSQLALSSPGTASVRKTRASSEREERRKEDEARESKESKEARKMAEQLEKARAKVKEEAHVHHLEQERVAAMQKQIAARKEQEKLAKASQVDVPRATRSSPRKTKAQIDAEGVAASAATIDELAKDIEMSDASAMPPPAAPRPKSQISRPTAKRPLKPAKEPLMKAKQPPTIIRVNTGSQNTGSQSGHPYHPSTSTLAATLQESLAPTSSSQGTLRNKASNSSIQSKSSTSSFKSAASKALERAARKKEQDELVEQRKREAKLDIERQRAALKEEERRKEEQQRRQEISRQKEVQREREQAAAETDAKRTASRQAIEKRKLEMEKAKQTKAPPPAIRPQPNGDLKSSIMQEKALPPAPPQRAEPARMNTSAQRPQEDLGRSMNSVLQNTAKAPPKRPLQQDIDDNHRPTIQRNPASYQHNDSHHKRRKTSETFGDDEEEDMTEPHPKMTAPPIRQSSSRPKEMPTKSLFSSGYANVPQPNNLQRSTLISQHNMNQSKPAHPMDMTQVSKAPIAFAPSSSQANAQSHKTPARPGALANGGKSAGKSAARSSPRYQNGENIELPEINTDSEDDDDDKDDFVPLAWANSPALRSQIAKQETIDPSEIFGQPGALNMEEVFPKSKDRFHKFRARTSSANWSGQDRLTDDEVRKDLEARDRVRRQGGWTYDSMV